MADDIAAPPFDGSILQPGDGEAVVPVYTLPLNEFKFKQFCIDNGLVCYLPVKRNWKIHNVVSKGRPYSYKKQIYSPLFPSYVFVKSSSKALGNLFASKVIHRILPVADQAHFLNELRTVRAVELVGFSQKLEFHCDIKEGDRFIMLSGPWEGVSGWLVERNRQFKWTVEIEFLNELVRATIDPSLCKMERLDS